jgi:hypothetical protein
MLKKLISKIPHRVVVNCDRNPYLTRWYLFRRPAFAIFLHRFHRSDEDRALHDHPWSFITVILWRGYLEHTPEGTSRKWPGMICYRPAEWRHRVELINGKQSFTLVFRFRERRVWGFWEKTGFVKWNHWWQQNCE